MYPTTGPAGYGADVVLRVPANPTVLPVARTLAAAVSSQWGFTLDVVEDARLIVSELLTWVVQAAPGCLTEVIFSRDDATLRLTVHTDDMIPAPALDSFGWLVVSELSRDVAVRADADGLTITASLSTTGTAG